MTASRFTERLTQDNAAVVLVDQQVGLYSGVRDIPVGELERNVVGLAKAAQVLGLPLVVTTTAAAGMWGPMIPELAEVLPHDLEVIDRSTVNAWDDERVRAAIDASRTFWQAKRDAGLLRMHQAGVILADYATTMVEILGDNAHPLAGELYAALDMPFAVLVAQIADAYTKN